MFAFFMEATFFAIMFFGWDGVKEASTSPPPGSPLVVPHIFPGSLILVANAWMQYPTGAVPNPDTVRHEMIEAQ